MMTVDLPFVRQQNIMNNFFSSIFLCQWIVREANTVSQLFYNPSSYLSKFTACVYFAMNHMYEVMYKMKFE